MTDFRVSLYIRVSTDKQTEGESLEEQESELKKFCEYKNYIIHKTYIERGRSAKNTKRPEYQKLLLDVENKKINAVVVKKLDRLSRSLLDFEEFMKTAQEYQVEFISLKENFDTTNAMGKAMLRVALVFAQLEREQTAERITDVMHYRASQGLYNGGGIPFGYNVINREILINKKEKKVVEFMFNRFILVKSTSAITREVNTAGYRTRLGDLWDTRKIDKILRRPIYTGQIQWGNKLYKGVHQPIITESTFQKVKQIFESQKKHGIRNTSNGLLKGLVNCSYCGSPLSISYTKKKNNKKYYYYRCTANSNHSKMKGFSCKSNYYALSRLEQEVVNKILEISSTDFLNNKEAEFSKSNIKIEKEIATINNDLKLTEQRLLLVKNKKEKYLDSLISGRFNNKERNTINEKIEEFSLEEKQYQSQIYQYQFSISGKSSSLKSANKFKEEIIFFKLNHSLLKHKELLE
ncbi:recombinase family protein [bacterium]|nr:recombinase family protein [bacterium]MDC0977721.1 recombinase family protein [bacterium]